MAELNIEHMIEEIQANIRTGDICQGPGWCWTISVQSIKKKSESSVVMNCLAVT